MPRFALTFDDGPGPSTAPLLDVLRAARVRATFFVLGRNIDDAPWCAGDAARARSLMVRALREGHLLGNHTYSHELVPDVPAFVAEVRRVDGMIRSLRREAALADDASIPFRLPYGIHYDPERGDPRFKALAGLGRAHAHWTASGRDWELFSTEEGAELCRRMIEFVLQDAVTGIDTVFDLHDCGEGPDVGYERHATVEGVRLFLREAERRDWPSFVFSPGL